MKTERQETIDLLIAKSREVTKICKEKYPKKVSLDLIDHNDGLTDLSGWVLHIDEYLDLYGDLSDWEHVGQIKISELDENQGNPKWRAYLHLDESNGIVLTQVSIPATPAMIIEYLDHIAIHGTALVQIPQRGKE